MYLSSRNHCCHGKVISIKNSECVCVALLIKHANLMRRIILSFLTSLVLQHSSILPLKQHDFRKNLLHTWIRWQFSLQPLSKNFPMIGRIEQNVVIKALTSLSTRCSPHVLMKLEFSQEIFEKYSSITFHENLSSGSRDFPCRRADGERDMTKLIVSFLTFEKVLINFDVTSEAVTKRHRPTAITPKKVCIQIVGFRLRYGFNSSAY